MSYFSRLTDIVTCNLTHMLNESDDPKAAIEDIIREMREGVAGAQRSVSTAENSERRLRSEIDEQRAAAATWTERARNHLASNSEDEARSCLLRKRETEDLVAGLEQQYRAAVATKEHLYTMQRALEARLSEALRKQESLDSSAPVSEVAVVAKSFSGATGNDRQRSIDDELEALRQELENK